MNRFFWFSFDSARRIMEKRSSESYTSKFLLLYTFSLLLVIIKPRKWGSVVDCVRLCPEGSCFLVIYAPRVNHCSKRRQETLSNCKSICIWLRLYVYVCFFCFIPCCRRYRLCYENSNLNSNHIIVMLQGHLLKRYYITKKILHFGAFTTEK